MRCANSLELLVLVYDLHTVLVGGRVASGIAHRRKVAIGPNEGGSSGASARCSRPVCHNVVLS
jgi:hypothetical protein